MDRVAPGPVVASRSPRTRWFSVLAAGLFYFALAVMLQRWGGAYRTELSGYPDEPAHYVTGVMVSRYLSTLPPAPMVPFAADYYVHYPKVAIGHWPPVFPLIQGTWFLVFGVSRASVLLLMALISSLVSGTLFVVVRKESGLWAGVGAGLLFQCVPVVWVQTGQVMADLLVALFGLWAVLAFAWFVEADNRASLFLFALFANLAVFTKSNGIFLAIVPPVALVLTRHSRRMLSLRLWFAGFLAALPAAVWFAYTHAYFAGTWAEAPSLSFFLRAMGVNARLLVSAFGVLFSALICAGLFRKTVGPVLRRENVGSLWAALAAAAFGVYVCQCVFSPGLESRFLVPAIAALIPFLFVGTEWLARLTAPLGGSAGIRAAVLLTCAAAYFIFRTAAVPSKPYCGFTEAAEFILSHPESHGAAVLVSSEADGEGLLVAEIVMREPRPLGFVLRASKLLSHSDWLSRNYRARFSSAGDTLRYLEDIPVDYLVLDERPGLSQLSHHRLLAEAMKDRPDRWRLAGAFPRGNAPQVRVYQRIGAPGRPDENVRLEMGRILQEILSK